MTLVSADPLQSLAFARDGNTLLYVSDGKLFRVPAAGGNSESIRTGSLTGLSNPSISPDGSTVAVNDANSRIHVIPVAGGEPRHVKTKGAASVHGWSPDGKLLLLAARREGKRDIYTIAVDGGAEARLTSGGGHNATPRVLARRQAHLLQLRPVRNDASLADVGRRLRAAAANCGRLQQLVPPPVSRRKMPGHAVGATEPNGTAISHRCHLAYPVVER